MASAMRRTDEHGRVGQSPGSFVHGRDAFADLYLRHAEGVERLVAARVADPDLASDVVQETFLRAYRYFGGFDPERPFWPWLATIAANVCADALRVRAERRESLCDTDDLDAAGLAGPTGPDHADHAAELDWIPNGPIGRALGALPASQRRLLLLRAHDGWRYDELAVLEGLTLDAVKSLLKRARANFRRAYDRRGRAMATTTLPALGRLRRRAAGIRCRASVSATSDYFGSACRLFTVLAPMVAAAGAILTPSVDLAVAHPPSRAPAVSSYAAADRGEAPVRPLEEAPTPIRDAHAVASTWRRAAYTAPLSASISVGSSHDGGRRTVTGVVTAHLPGGHLVIVPAGLDADCAANDVRRRACDAVDRLPVNASPPS